MSEKVFTLEERIAASKRLYRRKFDEDHDDFVIDHHLLKMWARQRGTDLALTIALECELIEAEKQIRKAYDLLSHLADPVNKPNVTKEIHAWLEENKEVTTDEDEG